MNFEDNEEQYLASKWFCGNYTEKQIRYVSEIADVDFKLVEAEYNRLKGENND